MRSNTVLEDLRVNRLAIDRWTIINIKSDIKSDNWMLLHERTEHLDIFLFSAHHSMVFYFWCSVYWWKGNVRF